MSGIEKKIIFKIERGWIQHPFLNVLLKLSEYIDITKKEIIDCDVIYTYDFEIMKHQCEDIISDIEEMKGEDNF